MARALLIGVAAALVALSVAQPTPPLPEFTEALRALYTNTHGDGW